MNDKMTVEFKSQSLKCKNHGNDATLVINDFNLPFWSAVLCKQCLQEQKKIQGNALNMKGAQELIIEKTNQFIQSLKEISKQYIDSATKLEEMLVKFLNSMTKNINAMQKTIEAWRQDLQKIEKNYLKIDFATELKEYFERAFQMKKVDDIEKINTNHFCKLNKPFMDLLKFDDIKQCYAEFITIFNQNQGWEKLQKEQQLQPIKIEEVGHLPCSKKVNQIIMNQQKIIASCGKNLQIFELKDNKLIAEQQQLQGHKATIQCLAASQNNKWIVSADIENILRTWKFVTDDKSWKSVVIGKEQNDAITGMLLNQIEDTLFTYGKQKIFVWKVNQEINTLQIQDELNSTGNVLSASLNESETSLISSHDNNMICLWKRGFDKIWRFNSFLTVENSMSHRICFVSQKQFIFQQKERAIMNIFEVIKSQEMRQDYQLEKILNLFEFPLQNDQQDEGSFPVIYNKKKRILIQKHNHYVYVIKLNINGAYEIKHQINCESQLISGGLSDNGENLVLWSNNNKKQFTIYKISYK